MTSTGVPSGDCPECGRPGVAFWTHCPDCGYRDEPPRLEELKAMAQAVATTQEFQNRLPKILETLSKAVRSPESLGAQLLLDARNRAEDILSEADRECARRTQAAHSEAGIVRARLINEAHAEAAVIKEQALERADAVRAELTAAFEARVALLRDEANASRRDLEQLLMARDLELQGHKSMRDHERVESSRQVRELEALYAAATLRASRLLFALIACSAAAILTVGFCLVL